MSIVSTAATQSIAAVTGHKLRWWKAQPWWPSAAKMSRDAASGCPDISVRITGFPAMIPAAFSDVLDAVLADWTVVNENSFLTLRHRIWSVNDYIMPPFDEPQQALDLLGLTSTQTEYDSQVGLRSAWAPSDW